MYNIYYIIEKIMIFCDIMKFNKIFLFTLILLAALSVSAVSAESFDNNTASDVIVSEQNSEEIISASEPLTDTNQIVTNDVEEITPLSGGNSSTDSNGTTPDTNGSGDSNGTTPDTNGSTDGNGTTPDTNGSGDSNGTIPDNGTTPDDNGTNVTNSSIISGDISLFYKNGTKFSAIFLDADGKLIINQNITFVINGVSYNRTTDANGTATIAINLAAGKYIIESKNPVTNESVKNNLTVISTINTADIIKFYKNGTQYYATFVDGQGNVLVNKTVKFNINGVFYNRTTNASGVAKLNINLYPGNYVITAYNPINNEAIASNVTVLSTINGSDIKKYVKNATQYIVTLVDGQGNALVNQTVKLNINGVFYNRSTNANGTINFNINLNPGNYTITVYNPETEEESSNNVLVLSRLVTKDISVDYQAGGKYSVTLVDEQGNPIANKTVKLNINGVFYNRDTNENGTAYLNINLIPGDYVCSAYYDDLVTSSKVTVNKLTAAIAILTPTLKTGEYYQAKITEKTSGKAIVGERVLFIWNGTAYGAYSDSEGIAKVKIGLPAGSYQLITGIQSSSWYQNIAVYNTLTVTA